MIAPDSKATGVTAPTFWFYSLDVVEIDLVPLFVPLALLSPRQDRVEVWLQPHLGGFMPGAEPKGERSSLEQIPCGVDGSFTYIDTAAIITLQNDQWNMPCTPDVMHGRCHARQVAGPADENK